MADKKVRVAVYLRADNEDLIEIIKKHYINMITERNGMVLTGFYVDIKKSAYRVDNREEFGKMISDAENSKFDKIITPSMTCFSRNMQDLFETLQRLGDCGVGVYFENDGVGTALTDGEVRMAIRSVLE